MLLCALLPLIVLIGDIFIFLIIKFPVFDRQVKIVAEHFVQLAVTRFKRHHQVFRLNSHKLVLVNRFVYLHVSVVFEVKSANYLSVNHIQHLHVKQYG